MATEGGALRAVDEGVTRRLKALACTAPLHDLDARKTRLDWVDATHYRPRPARPVARLAGAAPGGGARRARRSRRRGALGAALSRAAREAGLADAEVAGLDERADRLEQDAPRLARAVEDARARAAALAALLAEVRRRPELEEQVRAATAAVERAKADAATARVAAAAARRDADQARRSRDRQRAVSDSSRTELTELPLDGIEPDGDSPDVALEVLRAEYRNAEAAYSAAEVDADLRARLGD